jgi:hypothetical protein
MTRQDEAPAVQWPVRPWWVWLPLVARRLSRGLLEALVDGLYLGVRPLVGALAPPLCLVLGFLCGWLHPGFSEVFSESLLVLALAAVIGTMSANLGLMFLAGFVLGDFLLAHRSWTAPGGLVEHLLRVRVPLLIEYNLLGLLTVGTPLFTKALLVQLTPPDALSRRVRLVIAVLGHLALTGVLVFFWAQSVPLLIRPVFTWRDMPPPSEAMVPLQEHGVLVVIVAMAASLGRMLLQGQTVFRPELEARLDVLQARLTSEKPITPIFQRFPAWLKALVRSSWATLLLAGMYSSWLEALLLGALTLFIQLARAGLVRVPLGGWPAWIERVPLLFRLVAAFVVVYLLALPLLGDRMWGQKGFSPILILTGMSMIILYLVAPGASAGRPKGGNP